MKFILENPNVALLETLFPIGTLFAVGGCVRDVLLNRVPKDIDFCTSLKPEEVIQLLEKASIKYIKTGIRRGTLTAIINSIPYEITTFRKKGHESEYSDSIIEDLSARDFTINAIALNIATENLIDPFNGIKDIKTRILRSVGIPDERFTEDPHRILRLIRFSEGFKIDPITGMAAAEHSFRIKEIAPERIHDELIKILLLDNPKAALLFMNMLGILQIILPELHECVGVSQNKYHFFDVFGHTLEVLNNTKKDKITRLAALLHDIGKPHVISTDEAGVIHFYKHEVSSVELAQNIMQRLRFSNEDIKAVLKLITFHMKPTNMSNKRIRRLILELGSLLPNWLDLKYADTVYGGRPQSEQFKVEFDIFKLKLDIELHRPAVIVNKTQLSLNGHDLINIGIAPGPIMGIILNKLLDYILEFPEENIKEVLLKKAKEIYESISK